MTNSLKTILLMALMIGLLLFLGEWLGGEQGLVMAFMFSLLMNFGMYWFSSKIVLMTYGAREVTEAEAPRLTGIVRRLATQAQLPMPKVYIIPGDSPNAFATGRNPEHAAVAATEGILRILSDDELEGVISHELAHVKHRDILIATLVATMAGTIAIFVARMAMYASFFGGGSRDREDSHPIGQILLIILAPIAAMLIQFAVSRSREFAADEGGAQICQRPLSLANALRKLEKGVEQIPMQNAGPATAHMFIVNPLFGGGITKLFSTHPPTEERIARLEQLAMGRIAKGICLNLTRSISCAVLLILLAGSDAVSLVNDSTGVNRTTIIRTQLQSIADEVVDSAKFDVQGRVAIFVEGEGSRTLAENAFAEALQKKNYTSVIIDTVSLYQILHVFLFSTEMKIRELNTKISERNIRISLEVRTVKGVERQVRMLGTFHRETKDTMQIFTTGVLSTEQKNDEGGVFQRMLTPFVVVGGVIVIVYLFFTVRS